MTKYKILCTRELEPSLIEQATQNNIDMDVIPFIETKPIDSLEVYNEIENTLRQTMPVVFTSMNAVDAVAAHLQDYKPEWKIYCIGNTTRKLVEKYFGNDLIVATAKDATELAEKIVEDDGIDEVLFFCGDKRRDEVPALLNQHEIEVHEIEVYRTKLIRHNINKSYDGILFFSPSAVISFFRYNTVYGKTILFAIGNTTANEIKKYSGNMIVTSEEAGKKNLVESAIIFFDKDRIDIDNDHSQFTK